MFLPLLVSSDIPWTGRQAVISQENRLLALNY